MLRAMVKGIIENLTASEDGLSIVLSIDSSNIQDTSSFAYTELFYNSSVLNIDDSYIKAEIILIGELESKESFHNNYPCQYTLSDVPMFAVRKPRKEWEVFDLFFDGFNDIAMSITDEGLPF